MASGGCATERSNFESEVVKRAPSLEPPFTLSDIKRAIPPHCFNRSLLLSSSHLFIDLFLSFLLYYVAAIYITRLPTSLLYVAWPVYWILQGSIQMGLWIIGHECGHHAFCDYPWLNDTIGYFLHTSLLAPYFSWKYSHSRHHSHTASLENDESFVPRKKSSLNKFSKFLNTPPGRLFRLVILCTIGWLLYVCFNVAGKKYEKFANHFDPKSPIYNDSERFQILLTDIGLIVTSYGLYKLALAQGFTWLVMIYFAPLVIVYGYLAIITWLNHTHRSLPHYDSTEWNWLKGALSMLASNETYNTKDGGDEKTWEAWNCLVMSRIVEVEDILHKG
ncbi:bifunctional desaturase/conjugase [Artemisia annua]|uniref:Bifunctional desaturase/conjugase n=1 Tax=Artemisia annua TaxID=35608 RepID=A0A2U1KHJ3_ARTAN|nr:bifunctional desaturase/conjugase [Artemisia annua]